MKMTALEMTAAERHTVASLKRFLEYWTMEKGFAERFRADEERTLGEVGLSELGEDRESLRLLVFRELADSVKGKKPEELPPNFVLYRRFVNWKLRTRQELQETGCAPEEPAFRAWRKRQINRCWAELGTRNEAIVHTPLTFELALGCSVGCPFCGVMAGKLTKVFRGTEENLKLWRQVLIKCRELIGGAAGDGTCYYATEPLDNPEYESFASIYFEELGEVPQLTSAASMRNPERTRAYLKLAASQQERVHRFSVLSYEIFQKIMAFFTPDELLFVELLPQFAEAPACGFSGSGRARSYDCEKVVKNDGDTISCVTGFVINMAEKSIRLSTPCGTDDEHPTGEIKIAREFFTDIDDFAAKLTGLRKKYFCKAFPKTQVLRLRPGTTIEKLADGIIFRRENGFKLKFTGADDLPAKYYLAIANYLPEGRHTAYDIAGELMDKGLSPAQVFYILDHFVAAGLLLEAYE